MNKMRVLLFLLIPLLSLFLLSIFDFSSTVISLIIFFLTPFVFLFRKRIFKEYENEIQIVFAVGFCMYLFNIILYALAFDNARHIMNGSMLILLIGVAVFIYRVTRASSKRLRDLRLKELGMLYLIANFAWVLALLNHFHN